MIFIWTLSLVFEALSRKCKIVICFSLQAAHAFFISVGTTLSTTKCAYQQEEKGQSSLPLLRPSLRRSRNLLRNIRFRICRCSSRLISNFLLYRLIIPALAELIDS